MALKTVNGDYNRFEILDKRDVLLKLNRVVNDYIHSDPKTYHRICDEMSITANSSARLYVFDNKRMGVYALNLEVYNKLHDLLDSSLNMNLD